MEKGLFGAIQIESGDVPSATSMMLEAGHRGKKSILKSIRRLDKTIRVLDSNI